MRTLKHAHYPSVSQNIKLCHFTDKLLIYLLLKKYRLISNQTIVLIKSVMLCYVMLYHIACDTL